MDGALADVTSSPDWATARVEVAPDVRGTFGPDSGMGLLVDAASSSGTPLATSCDDEFWLGGLPGAATGEGAAVLVAGDFNGDGKLDLATGNAKAKTISVLFGRGNATFRAKVDYQVGAAPRAIVTGDWNHDGKTDLAMASSDPSTVTVFLNQENGTFKKLGAYPVAAPPSAMVAADFDGDGVVDLAVAAEEESTVSILYGKADGTFSSRVDYPTEYPNLAMVAADLNGDGRLDIVTGSASAVNLTIMLGKTGRQFATTYKELVRPTGVGEVIEMVVGDFSGDGALDLALVYCERDCGVYMLAGDGKGDFPSQTSFPNLTWGSLGAADLDGDGQADLAVFSVDQQLIVIRGPTSRAPVTYPTVNWGRTMVFADFTGDGKPDIAMLDSDIDSVMAVPGNGDGTFPTLAGYRALSGDVTEDALFARDLDRDGRLDLLTVSGSNVKVRLGKGDGTLDDAVINSQGTGSQDVDISDVNGDGNLDVVMLDADKVRVLSGKGKGSFQAIPDVAIGRTGQCLAVGDVNGDGKADLAIRHWADHSVALWLGAGDGTFTHRTDVSASHSESTPRTLSHCIALRDLNGDAIPDLIVFDDAAVTVALASGDGSFGPPGVYTVATGSEITLVGDLNGDKVLDIAISHPGGQTVLMGRSDGTFAAGIDHAGVWPENLWSPRSSALADFNGDGRLDFIRDVSWNKIAVKFGNGDGTFGCLKFYSNGIAPFTVGDMNGDGRPDLLVDSAPAVLMNKPL